MVPLAPQMPLRNIEDGVVDYCKQENVTFQKGAMPKVWPGDWRSNELKTSSLLLHPICDFGWIRDVMMSYWHDFVSELNPCNCSIFFANSSPSIIVKRFVVLNGEPTNTSICFRQATITTSRTRTMAITTQPHLFLILVPRMDCQPIAWTSSIIFRVIFRWRTFQRSITLLALEQFSPNSSIQMEKKCIYHNWRIIYHWRISDFLVHKLIINNMEGMVY